MSRAPTQHEIQAASSSHVGSWCGKTSAPRRSSHPARVARRSVRPSSVLPWRAALHDRPSRRVGVARRVVDLLRCSTSPALHSAQPPADKSVVESSACAHHRTRRLGPSITRTPAHACPTTEPRICLPQLASSGHLVVSPCILVHTPLSVYIASSSMSSFSTNVSRGGHEHTCATWTARARVPVPHLARARAMLWCARAPGCGRRMCR